MKKLINWLFGYIPKPNGLHRWVIFGLGHSHCMYICNDCKCVADGDRTRYDTWTFSFREYNINNKKSQYLCEKNNEKQL